MKGMVGIGGDRMEEGEISTITLRQIERMGRTQTLARCTIKNSLKTAPIYWGNASTPAGGVIQKSGYKGSFTVRRQGALGKAGGRMIRPATDFEALRL